MQGVGVYAGESGGSITTLPRRGKSILRCLATVDNIAHVVIPTVGVIIGNNDNRVRPLRSLLEGGDYADEKFLLIQGIGVTGVAVAISCRLEIANRGKFPGF